MERTHCNPCTFQVQLDSNSLFQVFSLLETKDKQNAAQVCQYWRDTAYVSSLWKNVRVVLHNNLSVSLIKSLNQRKITQFVCQGSKDEDLALLFETNPDITYLHITGCRHVSQKFLERNLKKLDNLVSLHITECRQIHVESLYEEKSVKKGVLSHLKSFTLPKVTRMIGYWSLQSLLKRCPNLEEIGYDGDIPLDHNICPAMILAKLCPKLQRIKLGHAWMKNKDIWKDAFKSLDLKALDLDMRRVSLTGLKGSIEESLMYLDDIFTNLECLKLCCKDRIPAEAVIALAEKLKNLKHFDFSALHTTWPLNLRDRQREIFYAASKMTQLETLKINFSGILEISAESIYTIVEGMPNLKKLELDGVKDMSPEYADLIREQLPKLRSFKVVVATSSDGSGTCAFCGKLGNLTDLTIKHSGLLNQDLIQMSTGLIQSSLKSFTIAGSQKVKDQGIISIANAFKSLTCLDVTSCSVTDSGVAVIAEQLKQLQRLSVTGRKVTNHGGIMIGKHLKQMEHLKISGTKIGDQGFAFICHQLQHLHTLQAFCDRVTDQGFQEGARGLGKLITLQIGSHNIRSKEFLNSLVCLKSAVHLTIRAITVDDDGIQKMLKEMPSLSKLSIHRCNHFRIPQDEVLKFKNRQLHDKRVTLESRFYPCKNHPSFTGRSEWLFTEPELWEIFPYLPISYE